MIKVFTDIVRMYYGPRYLLILLLFAASAVYLYRKKDDRFRVLLVLMAMLLLFVCNPLSRLFWSRILKAHLYWRLFWMIPGTVVFGAVLTDLVFSASGLKKAGVIALFALAVSLAGRNIYTSGNFTRSSNFFKLPESAAAVGNYIMTKERRKITKVLAPSGLYCYLRQYDPNIRMVYGRNIEGYTAAVEDERTQTLYGYMCADNVNVPYIFGTAGELKCQYVILEEAKALDGDVTDYGYEADASIGAYTLYRKT